MTDLFTHQARKAHRGEPLAERVRPTSLDQVAGQAHLLGPGKLLRRVIQSDRIPSMVLWGPPGSGKTILARVIATTTGARFRTLSAVGSGVKELRQIMAEAAEQRDLYGKRTILFIDEIHRYNKAQQDALLPQVEAGTVVLMGATTENPSFEVISALLSRCRVVTLEPLSEDDLVAVLERALARDPALAKQGISVPPTLLRAMAAAAHGDARRALTTLEVAASLTPDQGEVGPEEVAQATQGKTLLYDRAGDEHYNVISAFIKSLRGSDPDAALYWMVRMLEAGEDPIFVLRRMVIFASEDVGNADPEALRVAVAALDAVRLVGLPEGTLPMTQAATYLASAPKSNAVLTAYTRARKDVLERGALPVPLHLRNAPTSLMKALGHGKAYKYPHNFEGHYVAERYLPEALAGRRYYEPSDSGAEAEIRRRLARWRGEAGEGGEA